MKITYINQSAPVWLWCHGFCYEDFSQSLDAPEMIPVGGGMDEPFGLIAQKKAPEFVSRGNLLAADCENELFLLVANGG